MPDTIRSQLVTHIRFYGELLYRAGLLEARLEVLAITNEKPLELEVNVLDRNHLSKYNITLHCRLLNPFTSYPPSLPDLLHSRSRRERPFLS